MIPPRWMEGIGRNRWLLAALGICVAGCLLLGGTGASITPEERIGSVLSCMAGAGRTEIAIYSDAEGVPCGALVLSAGADDIAVRLQITRAVSTLLGLDAEAVVVYPLGGDR